MRSWCPNIRSTTTWITFSTGLGAGAGFADFFLAALRRASISSCNGHTWQPVLASMTLLHFLHFGGFAGTSTLTFKQVRVRR